MGFGIATNSNRKWTFPILYFIDESFTLQKRFEIIMAMDSWGGLFRPVPEIGGNYPANPPIFIKLDTKITQWQAGDKLNGKSPGTGGTVAIQADTKYGNLVHEFGHCLGLSHEHDRADAIDYLKTLKSYKDAPGVVLTGAANARQKYVPHGSFDPQSVMCYPNAQKEGPSDGDYATINAIYGAGTTKNYRPRQ